MNNKYKVKNGLHQVGERVFLYDGNWISVPFYAVLSPRWKNSKSDFELKETEIGRVSADYYTYIGPFDHNILSLSDKAYLMADGVKYIFRKKESVKMGNKVLFYRGILRKVWEEND
ncbi:MAG: hypothetical protein K2J55_04970 [Eubacterium sp.]|nr:hypothetical protein [Eubacterium sp.]